MSDDIKLPEPAGYGYESKLDDIFPYFTADQLRAAVLADRKNRFKKERQQLENEWTAIQALKKLHMSCRETDRAHGIVEKESTNG